MTSNEIERSLDNLFGDDSVKTLSRQRVEHELRRLSQTVEFVTRDKALLSLQSTQDVANLYNVSRQSINTRAARLREKRGSFGWRVGRGVWVFTSDEARELKPRERSGRP